jgi:hypothetical protein
MRWPFWCQAIVGGHGFVLGFVMSEIWHAGVLRR